MLEGLWLATKREAFKTLYLFWVKVFALSFGMGVVSGVVMSYQFGTNWSEFSRQAGGVIGPLLAYEVLTAFFLEASFLGRHAVRLAEVGPGPALPGHRRWWRSAPCSRPSGSCRPTAGCSTPSPGPACRTGGCMATDFVKVIFNPTLPIALRPHGAWPPI